MLELISDILISVDVVVNYNELINMERQVDVDGGDLGHVGVDNCDMDPE